MLITPNLHFNGNCQEAMNLYEKTFAGKLTQLIRYHSADPADFNDPLTEEQKNYVYHAEMTIAGQRFFFSDSFDPVSSGRNMSIVITLDTPDEVRSAYNLLIDGGAAIHPLTETTYSSCFASLVDKFGMRWEIMTETE